jgi:hypothetical protein
MHVELDDVYDVWTTSFWQTFIGKITIVAGIVGAILLCYGIYKLIKKYRVQSTKERALQGLRMLKQRVEKADQDSKKVYQLLTEHIKTYTQWRFHLAKGLSDYELMSALSNHELSAHNQEELRRIMSQAQAIKFGLAVAQRAQMKHDIDTVISFITSTEQEMHKRGSLEV